MAQNGLVIAKVWNHLMRKDTWWSYGGGGLTRLELYACMTWIAGCIAASIYLVVTRIIPTVS